MNEDPLKAATRALCDMIRPNDEGQEQMLRRMA